MLRRLGQGARTLANSIGAGLFATLFLVFIVQIVARFGFNKPMAWTDEAAVCLYVWVILWAAATIVPEREHVVFDLLWNACGRGARRVLRITGNLMLGGLAAWALPGVWDYVHFMAREATPVLGVSFQWVFMPFVALLVALVIRCTRAVWRAWHGLDLEDAGLPVA